jgi:hypothetical protein
MGSTLLAFVVGAIIGAVTVLESQLAESERRRPALDEPDNGSDF